MSSKVRPQRPHISERINSSSSSLIDRGMKIAVPPGQLMSSSFSPRYANKDLPPIPKDESLQETVRRPLSKEYSAIPAIATLEATPLYEMSASPIRSAEPQASTSKSAIPPMTKSSHKILQLTGFDPRFEKTFPKDHQQVPISPVSTTSSGSVYSQPEESPDSPITPNTATENTSRFSSWGSDAPAKGKTGEIYLKAESYSSGERDASSNSSLASSRKERPLPVSKLSQDAFDAQGRPLPVTKRSQEVVSHSRERSPARNVPQNPVASQERAKSPAMSKSHEPIAHHHRGRPPAIDRSQEPAAPQREERLPVVGWSQEVPVDQRSPMMNRPQELISPYREERSRVVNWSQDTAAHQKRDKQLPEPNPLGLIGLDGASEPQRRERPPRAKAVPPTASQQRPLINPSGEPVKSFKYRDRSPKTLKNGKVLPLLVTPEMDLEEMTTLRELLEEEQWKHQAGTADMYSQYQRQYTQEELDTPMPKPLTLRGIKQKTKPPKRVSILSSLGDSFAAGVNEITSPTQDKKFNNPNWQATSPSKTKHPNTPVTARTRFVLDESDESQSPKNSSTSPLKPGKSKRSIFGSGKHTLKSPFPFSAYVETSESDDAVEPLPSISPAKSENSRRFSKRLSGAIKRATSSRLPPIKRMSTIKNGQRDATGPDTPLPNKAGFNDHVQGVYTNARKTLNIKTMEERKRESLKKKIVLVGLTDQSPGMSPFSDRLRGNANEMQMAGFRNGCKQKGIGKILYDLDDWIHTRLKTRRAFPLLKLIYTHNLSLVWRSKNNWFSIRY